MDTRIDYLDGLKGFSALSILLFHIGIIGFFYAFVGFGSHYASDPAAARHVIYSFPCASMLVNVSTGLNLFFTLIALFPITKYRKQTSSTYLRNAAVKRYFQLLAPCLPVALLSVIFYWNGLYIVDDLSAKTGCTWITAIHPIGCSDVSNFLQTTFYSMWVHQDNRYPLSVLWCVYIIFSGSLSVYAAYALLGSSHCKYIPGIALLLMSFPFPHLAFFAMGSLLTEYAFVEEGKKRVRIPSVVLICIGVVLIKIPQPLYPIPLSAEYPAAVGSALVILGIHESRLLQKLLSCKVLTFLGSISYEIILVHFLFLVNIGCLTYSRLMQYTSSPVLLILAVFVVLLLPTLPSAWLLHRCVSVPVNRFLKKDFLGSHCGYCLSSGRVCTKNLPTSSK